MWTTDLKNVYEYTLYLCTFYHHPFVVYQWVINQIQFRNAISIANSVVNKYQNSYVYSKLECYNSRHQTRSHDTFNSLINILN